MGASRAEGGSGWRSQPSTNSISGSEYLDQPVVPLEPARSDHGGIALRSPGDDAGGLEWLSRQLVQARQRLQVLVNHHSAFFIGRARKIRSAR